MRPIGKKLWLIVMAFALSGTWRDARADDGCLDFKWDVTKERALFAGTPAGVTAGKDSKSAPALAPNRLYKIKLLPREQVTFAAVPGKKSPSQGSFAGIAALQFPASGSYRFAIDLPIWIDVVANGLLVAAKDFQGQHACSAPHKIVEFELPGKQPLLLQLSNAASEELELSITASPLRTL
jgi:hypothetical protein